MVQTMRVKEKLKQVALRSVELLGRAALKSTTAKGVALRPGPMVLMYHSVADNGGPYAISSDVFRAQMQYLLAQRVPLLTIAELAQDLAQNTLQPNAVCVTFDDAFETALEPLRWWASVGGKATLFVVAAEPGFNHWDAHRRDIPRLPRMSWDTLRQLSRLGIEIGAHSVQHPRLPLVPDTVMHWEVNESSRVIAQQCDCDVISFAYPYGAFDRRSVSAVQDAGYQAAVTTQSHYVDGDTVPLLIPRFEPTTLSQLVSLEQGHAQLLYRAMAKFHQSKR